MPNWKQLLGFESHQFESDEQKGAVEGALKAVQDEYPDQDVVRAVLDHEAPLTVSVAVYDEFPDGENLHEADTIATILRQQGAVEVVKVVGDSAVHIRPR